MGKEVTRRYRIKIKDLHAYIRVTSTRTLAIPRVMHIYMRICIRKLTKCSVNDIMISMLVDCVVYYEKMVCKQYAIMELPTLYINFFYGTCGLGFSSRGVVRVSSNGF